MEQNVRKRLRFLTAAALFSALAVVLQFFELSLPFVPSILKLEFSDLPALMAAFVLGPWAGLVVELLKNLIHLFFTWSGGVGELCNFLMGAALVLPAGFLYRRRPDFKGAVTGAAVGTAAMAVCSVPINAFISYPFYAAVMMPMEVILDMYRILDPSVETLLQALVRFNLPFTAAKGLLASAIVLLLYKRLIPVIRREQA